MKRIILQFSAFCLCLIHVTTAQANQNEAPELVEVETEANANFLTFLADIEEATGDGFEQWIEADSVLIDCSQNKPNIPLDLAKTCQDKQ